MVGLLNKTQAWRVYAAVALAALAPRLIVLFWAPQAYGDAAAYLRVADNIFHNFCVSLSDPSTGQCVPSWGGNQLPGYPAFIALVWSLVGESLAAVRVAQAIVVSLAIVWMARAVGQLTGSPGAALAAGLVLALSPLALAWPRHLFTETLALATTIWLFAELVQSLSQGRLRYVPLGLALAAAIFIRFDSVWLCLPVALCGFIIHPPQTAIRRGAILILVMAIPLGGWWARSVAVGLTPFPFSVLANGERYPAGYLAWANTWSTNEYQLAGWAFPMNVYAYSNITIDAPKAYRDSQEAARVTVLLDQLAAFDGQSFPSHIDEAFAALASERRSQDPLRQWLWLPLTRAVTMWGNPFTSVGWPTASEPNSGVPPDAVQQLVEKGISGAFPLIFKYPGLALYKAMTTGYRLLLIAAAAALLALSFGPLRQFRHVIWLAVAYAVGRTAFFSFFFLNSTRFMIEAAPAIEVAAVLGLLVLWRRRRRRRRAEGGGGT
jgi:hypothetical protein